MVLALFLLLIASPDGSTFMVAGSFPEQPACAAAAETIESALSTADQPAHAFCVPMSAFDALRGVLR